jgi:mRNA interferase RelE/StbE
MPEPQYAVDLVTSAAHEFRQLQTDLKLRVKLAINSLSSNPRPTGVRKLKGHRDLYRIRVGSYRVVYRIDDKAKLVRITRIRHRSEVYR